MLAIYIPTYIHVQYMCDINRVCKVYIFCMFVVKRLYTTVIICCTRVDTYGFGCMTMAAPMNVMCCPYVVNMCYKHCKHNGYTLPLFCVYVVHILCIGRIYVVFAMHVRCTHFRTHCVKRICVSYLCCAHVHVVDIL